tara:strand:+ start:251 stop:1561 length:1311 start_codon:yes stop_codon:yes gene_type:complete
MSKYNLTDILNEYVGGGRIGTLEISFKELSDKMDDLEQSGKVVVRRLEGPSGDGKVNREFEVVAMDDAVPGGNKQEKGFTVYDYKFGFDPGADERAFEEYPFSVGGSNLALAMELFDGVKSYGIGEEISPERKMEINEMINEGPFDVVRKKLLGLKDKILDKVGAGSIEKFKVAVKKALGKDKIEVSDITLDNARKVADELKSEAGLKSIQEEFIPAFKAQSRKFNDADPDNDDEGIKGLLRTLGLSAGLIGIIAAIGPAVFFGLIGLIIVAAGVTSAVTEDSNANSNYGSNEGSNENSNDNPAIDQSYSGLEKFRQGVSEIDIDSVSNDPGSGDADNPEGEELEAGSGYDAVEEEMYIDDDEFEMEMVIDRAKEIAPILKGVDMDIIVDFVKTHRQDIRGASDDEIKDEFNEFVSVNFDSVKEMKKLREHFNRFK